MAEMTVREKRVRFHNELLELCKNVYFQPPASIQMVYPCIVYAMDDVITMFAQNSVYTQYAIYNVTYIDKIPDSDVPKQLLQLEYADYQTFYVADNLNHTTVTIKRPY